MGRWEKLFNTTTIKTIFHQQGTTLKYYKKCLPTGNFDHQVESAVAE
jgi:hypothetical protein